VNLLRRSIPGRDLLATCFAEWSKAAAPTGKYSTARLQQAEAVFLAEKSAGSRDRNPVQAYRNICAVLKRSEFRVPSSELEKESPKPKDNQ
jgi:hypothetical protein